MCYGLLIVPIVCVLQMILRVIMTVVYAIEDLLRLTIHAVHNWISTVIHAITMIPMCMAYSCSRNCLCSTSCSPMCYPLGVSSCGWTFLFILMTIAILLVLRYTCWIDDLFASFGVKFPNVISTMKCDAPKKLSEVQPVNSNAVQTKPSPHVNASARENRRRFIMKLFQNYIKDKHEIRNELDYSYVDSFKENAKNKLISQVHADLNSSQESAQETMRKGAGEAYKYHKNNTIIRSLNNSQNIFDVTVTPTADYMVVEDFR